jgi:cobaltochelatase CobS
MSKMTKIRELFGLKDVPDSAAVPVRERIAGVPQAAYPPASEHYFFEPVLLKKLLRYFLNAPSRKNILLMGDTGVGKSSLIEQVATRIGWPIFSIACSGRMRLAHFVGSYELVNGQTRWRDGPLTAAMRIGGVFLADEITRLDHSEQMALAKVLDSGVITIPETGEMVEAHAGFRFCATGNSGGYGDESGAYNGERVSSVAFLDRFQKFKVDYMPEDEEVHLLRRVVDDKAPGSGLSDAILVSMVRLARDVRKNFVGRGGDLRTVISTRSLCVWALETVGYKGIAECPVEAALADTILNGSPTHEHQVIAELWMKWVSEP